MLRNFKEKECKPRAENQARLNFMPRCGHFYEKRVQTESRKSNTLEFYAEGNRFYKNIKRTNPLTSQPLRSNAKRHVN